MNTKKSSPSLGTRKKTKLPASETVWTITRSRNGMYQMTECSAQSRPKLLIASPDQRYFHETVYEMMQRKKEQMLLDGHVISYRDLTTPVQEVLGKRQFNAFLKNLAIENKTVSHKVQKNK